MFHAPHRGFHRRPQVPPDLWILLGPMPPFGSSQPLGRQAQNTLPGPFPPNHQVEPLRVARPAPDRSLDQGDPMFGQKPVVVRTPETAIGDDRPPVQAFRSGNASANGTRSSVMLGAPCTWVIHWTGFLLTAQWAPVPFLGWFRPVRFLNHRSLPPSNSSLCRLPPMQDGGAASSRTQPLSALALSPHRPAK